METVILVLIVLIIAILIQSGRWLFEISGSILGYFLLLGLMGTIGLGWVVLIVLAIVQTCQDIGKS